MIKSILLFLLAIVSCKDILEYNEADLEKAVNNNKQVAVLFYASWCPHCKRFMPQFKQVANSFSQYENVVFAKMNCVENREFCRKNLVIRYPTLRLFKDNSMKPLYYEGKRSVEDYLVFIAYHFNSPATLAPPVKLVRSIGQEEFTIAVNSMTNPTVVLIEKEGSEENTKAEKMIDHLAYNYLIEPDIHFKTYKFSSEIDIDELKGLSLPQLPTFVILFRNEVAVFRYVYDEYSDSYVLSEDGVIDFINDYANTDLTNQGSRYTIPGRIPDVDKILAKVKVFDRETISKIEEKVKKADRSFVHSKPVYLEVIDLLKEKGMDAIWKRLSEKRELIRKVEAEEQMQDYEEEEEEEEEDDDEEDELNNLEDLIVYRNIIRSFAKNVPVDHFEEEEL